jgi:Mg2+-importing ATPase
VLAACDRLADGETLDEPARARIATLVDCLAADGARAIAVASRPWRDAPRDPTAEDECGLAFEGLCTFADPPKATAAPAVRRLTAQGARVVILSGDDPRVVSRLAGLVGLRAETPLTGADIALLSPDALKVRPNTSACRTPWPIWRPCRTI